MVRYKVYTPPPYIHRYIELDPESASWMDGIVDTHIYCHMLGRSHFWEYELAKQCRDVGWRGFNAKRHHSVNADVCRIVNRLVPGFTACGGIVLGREYGGLNPIAVESALMLGARCVWMGNRHASTALKVGQKKIIGDIYKHNADLQFRDRPFFNSKAFEPMFLTDADGKLVPAVEEIVDLIAEWDVLLETCHISHEETRALVPYARQHGVKKILVTHTPLNPPQPTRIIHKGKPGVKGGPDGPITAGGWTITELQELVNMGACLELGACRNEPDIKHWANVIKAIGPDKICLASNLGAWTHSHPIHGMQMFLRQLHSRADTGISRHWLDKMGKDNTAYMLSIV